MRNRPLQPTPVPAINRVAPRAEEEPEVRWWHEWLCGCGEGPDRGGDHQVGGCHQLAQSDVLKCILGRSYEPLRIRLRSDIDIVFART